MAKVGVILNRKGELASLPDGEQIVIYECVDSKWTIIKEIEQLLPDIVTMKEICKFIDRLLAELDECKILIGSAITGVPFMILDKEGLMLCEADEISEKLLSVVENDYEKKTQEDKKQINGYGNYNQVNQNIDSPYPYETEEIGIYELDMIELQRHHPDLSSKKALIPFLRETKFQQLHIYCSHVMPWLDKELPARNLTFQAERVNNKGFRIVIEPK